MQANEIILEIDRLLRSLPPGDFWKRIRIAISPEENEAIKEFIFKYEETRDCPPQYFSRIRGVPIQIEANPTSPDMFVEFPK